MAGIVLGCSAPDALTSGTATPPQYLGLDSYLHWDKLPYLEFGDRVEGQSTADAGGSNVDNRGILGIVPDGERVLFDQTGPGVLTFARSQEQTGLPWTLRADGPPVTINGQDLGQPGPAGRFPYPLSLNIQQSQGSSILAAPVPYARTVQLTSAGANGNFYALYRKLPVDTPLTRQDSAEAAQVAALLRASGTDIAPQNIARQQATVLLDRPRAAIPVADINGKYEIRAISFRVPSSEAARFGNTRLQIFWDGEDTPSVDAPIKYLAGDGARVSQPVGRGLVQAFPVHITTVGPDTDFAVYWPMPFAAHAHIALIPDQAMTEPVRSSIRYESFPEPTNWVGKFHANFTDVPYPQPGEDMNFLDFHGSGKLVGTVVNFDRVGPTLEGDVHIYADGSKTPQIAVTGTEEWGMGGDYWHNGQQVTLPLAGLPSASSNPPSAGGDGVALYRFLIADSIPFNNRLVVNWEHGGANESTNHYRATMLWYGTPTETAVASDDLLPAAPASARSHGYASPADRMSALTAAYEQTNRSPLITNTVAETNGSSTFTMKLDPANIGAFLRRTLNSCVANQRANVFVDRQPAGTWYNAGASTKAGHDGHDRCWRDDDFPLPRSLTAGKSMITIRLDNVATITPSNTMWTAAEYQLYSFVLR